MQEIVAGRDEHSLDDEKEKKHGGVRKYQDAGFLSTITGEGMEQFISILEEETIGCSNEIKLSIPASRHDLISQIHKIGRVISMEYADDGTAEITAFIPEQNRKISRPFCLD